MPEPKGILTIVPNDSVCVWHGFKEGEGPYGCLFLPPQVAEEFGLEEGDRVEGETYEAAKERAGEVLIERARDRVRLN